MSSEFSREAMLATVKGSPAAVAAHDKAAWLGLFANSCLVNDPVGSKPHVDADAISRFYDTFIAPNDIRFDVDHDIVCGQTVARDAVIRITMGSGLQVSVPAHLRYELVEQDGDLRIRGLFAHWELMPMVTGTLRQGLRGWLTYARLSVLMIACQGVGGVLGFMRGFRGVGRAGKRRAQVLFDALAQGDADAVHAVVVADAGIEAPAGSSVTVAAVCERLRGAQCSNLMVAGFSVTARLLLDGKPGIALVEFDHKRRITRARFYIE